MASMTAAVAGVTTVASAHAGVRPQWPARSPAQARPRVVRSRVALVTRAAKKSAPKAPVEAETAPAEAPSTPPIPAGGLPPPAGYVPPRAFPRRPELPRSRADRASKIERHRRRPTIDASRSHRLIASTDLPSAPLSQPPCRCPPRRQRRASTRATRATPRRGTSRTRPPSRAAARRAGCSWAPASRSPWAA